MEGVAAEQQQEGSLGAVAVPDLGYRFRCHKLYKCRSLGFDFVNVTTSLVQTR